MDGSGGRAVWRRGKMRSAPKATAQAHPGLRPSQVTQGPSSRGRGAALAEHLSMLKGQRQRRLSHLPGSELA